MCEMYYCNRIAIGPLKAAKLQKQDMVFLISLTVCYDERFVLILGQLGTLCWECSGLEL